MNLTDLTTDVRRAVQEAAELAPETDADVLTSGRAAVSDEDIAERLLAAGRWAVAHARASLVPDLVRTGDPRDIASLPVLRVLTDRVTLQGNLATRQSVAGHRRMAATHRGVSATPAGVATLEYPTYVLGDGRLDVYPSGGVASATFEYVSAVQTLDDVPDVLREAVVLRTAATVALTEKRLNLFPTLFTRARTAAASLGVVLRGQNQQAQG